jgi:hypothetical protein
MKPRCGSPSGSGTPARATSSTGSRPEDDRLTNFWLAAYDPYDGPTNKDEFITWGYYETGTVADVCALLVLQPYRVVATADAAGEEQLRQECGRDVRVRLVRS